MNDFLDHFEDFEIIEDTKNEEHGQIKLSILNTFFYDNDITVVFDSQFSLFFKGWHQSFNNDEAGFNSLISVAEGLLFNRYKTLSLYKNNVLKNTRLLSANTNVETMEVLLDSSYHAVTNYWIAAKNRKYHYNNDGKIVEAKDEAAPTSDIIMVKEIVSTLLDEAERLKLQSSSNTFELGKAEGLLMAIDKISEAYLLRHIKGAEGEAK